MAQILIKLRSNGGIVLRCLQTSKQTSISNIIVWGSPSGGPSSLPSAVQDPTREFHLKTGTRSSSLHIVLGLSWGCSLPLSLCCRLMPCSVVHIKLCLLCQHLFSLIKRQRSDQLCPILFIELNFAEEKLQAGLGKSLSFPSRCCSAMNGCGDGMRRREAAI